MFKTKIPIISILLLSVNIYWYSHLVTLYGTTNNDSILLQNGAILGALFDISNWTQLVTALFIHLSVQHLIGNMIILFTLGTLLEKAIGSLNFTIIYFMSGFIGNAMVVVFQPVAITAGASTAIYGLFGYLISQLLQKNTPTVLKYLGQIYFLLILVNLIYTFSNPSTVSLTGHLGGFVTGYICGLIIRPFNI